MEDTPPLMAAGIVGDEIPTVDPLDSDGEWCEMPMRMGGLSTGRTSSQLTGPGEAFGFVGEKKKKKRKKKSKNVSCLILIAFQPLFACVMPLAWEVSGADLGGQGSKGVGIREHQ